MFIKNTGYMCLPSKFVSCSLPPLLLCHALQALHAGSLSKRLPIRMAMIFDVSVGEHDGLPFFIFRGCLHQVEGIESKLDVLRPS